MISGGNSESELKKIRRASWICLSLAVFIPVFFCLPFLFFSGNEDFPSWFQRSGSAMVVFALLAQFQAMKIDSRLNSNGTSECVGQEEAMVSSKYARLPGLLNITASTVMVIGTFIWGYGDILIKLLITN